MYIENYMYIVQPMKSDTYCSGDECRCLKLLTYSYTVEPFNRGPAGSPLGVICVKIYVILNLNWEAPLGTCLHPRHLSKYLIKSEVVVCLLFFTKILYILNHALGSVKEKGIRFRILDNAFTNSISTCNVDCTNHFE